ncbi:MAG: trehalase family glycosidase [Thermoleophilaceae bacterium]
MEADDARRLRARAAAVLETNWREGRARGIRYGFTCPGPPRYRHQWYWDSCFHAIAWSHFDPRRAREELRTLMRSASPDGLIPHTVFWDRPARWRRAPLYATRRIRGERATASTQTPLLALAWERVASASTDEPGFAKEDLAGLRRHYDWLERERDPDADGLISIILPDESGLDDSPKYDAVYGWMAHHRPGYFWLIERSRRLGYGMRAVAERHSEHVEDVLVNVFYALSLRALSRLLGERPGDGIYLERARMTERALLERCHDEQTGLFFDLAGPGERLQRVSTWSSLAPLALPDMPEPIRRRLVEEHLLDPRRYAAPTGIPSVALEEPSFRPGFDHWRCWRGPSWMNTAWLLVPPMRELGYADAADRVVASLAEAVARSGFREYYNPITGAGLGARGFGFATLLVDLLPAPHEAGRSPR